MYCNVHVTFCRFTFCQFAPLFVRQNKMVQLYQVALHCTLPEKLELEGRGERRMILPLFAVRNMLMTWREVDLSDSRCSLSIAGSTAESGKH